MPVLGVVPYLRGLNLPDEDAVSVEQADKSANPSAQVDLAVLVFPRIANFDDFDPLNAELGVSVRYVHSLAELGQPRAIILPGTKRPWPIWSGSANRPCGGSERVADPAARSLGFAGATRCLAYGSKTRCT